MPQSHSRPVPHYDTFASKNLLSRGQHVTQAVQDQNAVDISLQPGEISIHHGLTIHSSNRNPSKTPRVGFAIRYAPASAAGDLAGSWTDAIFLRGAEPASLSRLD